MAKELRSALSHIKLSSEGVYVQASTLGSLEALLEFLRTSKIPVSYLNVLMNRSQYLACKMHKWTFELEDRPVKCEMPLKDLSRIPKIE